MAIVPAVPGLEVTVETDNAALSEHRYDDEDVTNAEHEASSNSITTYLEVPSGAEFSVRWLMKEPFDATLPTYAAVMLDGNYLNGPLRETGDKDNLRGYKYVKTMSEEDGHVFTQTFRFSELEMDDQPHPTEGLKRQLEGIGTITVYLYYVISEEEIHDPTVPRLDLSPLGPMNEKISQKCAPTRGDVLTYQTNLTAPQVMRNSAFHQVQTENEPFASYTFLYRSTHALRSLGLIPRTPSPTVEAENAPHRRDLEGMTREELIAALSRLKGGGEKSGRVKRESEREGENIREKREREVDGNVEEVLWMGTRPAKRRAFVVLDG